MTLQQLKSYINTHIYENDERKISGEILNEILKLILDTTSDEITKQLVENNTAVQFNPITPTSIGSSLTNAIWFVTVSGTYINYGGVFLPENSFGIISKNGTKYQIQYNTFEQYDDTEVQSKIENNQIKNWTSSKQNLKYPTVRTLNGIMYRVINGRTSTNVAPNLDTANWEKLSEKAPIQSIDVNGSNVAPVDGKVSIVIPDAPVQSISVNGSNVEPVDKNVNIVVPDAPIKTIDINGQNIPPVNGNVTITVPQIPIQTIDVNGINIEPVQGNVSISIPEAPIKSIYVNNKEVTPTSTGRIDLPDAPIQSITVNGVEVLPNGAGEVNIEVNNVIEQTIDPLSTNAVASQAVASEFSKLSSKYGASLQLNVSGEVGEEIYSISLIDENGQVLSTTDQFAGGGGNGETSTTRIVLSKLTDNPTVKQGDEVKLKYYFDHQDTATAVSTGLNGTATITISAGATTKTIIQTLQSDNTFEIDVTNEMLVGSNNVKVRVEVDNGETIQVSTIAWRIQVVTLRLTSSFDYAQTFKKGSNITVPFNLAGSGAKVLRLLQNGIEIENRTLTASNANGSFIVPTTTLFHGANSLQLVAELEVTNTVKLLSNSIYFDVAITEDNKTTPIITTRFDYNDGRIITAGQRPVLVARQFEDYKVNYAGYNPINNQNNIKVTVGTETISNITTAFAQRVATGQSITTGILPATIAMSGLVYSFTVDVLNSDVSIEEPVDNIVFKLSAKGRTNADDNRNEWSNKGITTTLSGIQFEGDGWQNNALRLMNGGKAVINYAPLLVDNASTQNAFAFQTKIKVSKVTDTTKPLLTCMSGGVGFVITPEEAKFVTGGKSEVAMKFSSGQEYNIAFVSMPTALSNASEYETVNTDMVFLYINGVLSGGVQRGSGDNIYQTGVPTYITMGNDNAILDVYNTRCYNSYLTHDQVLNIFMLDLSTVDEIMAKYKANAIIDSEGDVTVESLPDGARYVIITGQQANGMSTVKYAAAINNKNTRYDVDEILHIKKGSDKSLNMKCTGGCLRLQGTSSLAYPIKNYRFYFRSANDSKVFGKVYTEVDEFGNGGTLIESAKPAWSFKGVNSYGKLPAPVNVWCLKADFAESSSSHNTGMARMVNDTLIQTSSPTPVQKYSTSPYDVRTTVDGEPCYMFYRNTVNDKPIFLGKYNLNNDKSTEKVFGFTDVDGYHDQTWVQDKFEGENPTECWEFLNNDFPMGKYLDDDFDSRDELGKPEWAKVFEARFPDVQDDYDTGVLGKPMLLSSWVTWVKSTKDNPTKFKSELSNFADVPHLCKYFAFTQIMGAVDQMVKNAMLAFWYSPDKDKMLAYYIFYDNDTILGVRNDGRLKYDWELNRQTLDPELTASAGTNIYAYMGHDSVLWNNLETQFKDEIRDAYKSIRSYLTNDRLFNYFNKDQSEKFAERIYNLDAQHKYIEPKTIGVDIVSNGNMVNTKYSYLESMQGSRMSHRKWWIENRLDLFDARYGTGEYTLTDITWKGISEAGAKVGAVLTKDYYIELRRESTSMISDFVTAGAEWSYTYNQVANVGTIFHLFGGKYFKKLDLSQWGGFTDLTFPNLESLETLILGNATKRYGLSELVIGTKFPLLSKIDITNYFNLPSLNLSACTSLKEVIAPGCDKLGTINLPAGSSLNKMVLPNALQTLKLEGLPMLKNENIQFPDGNTVKNLLVSSCPLIDWELLFDTLGTIENIRITGIDKTGKADFLDKFKNLGGLDSLGNIVATPRLNGTYYLTQYLDDATFASYKTLFPELLIVQPEYSVIEFDDTVSDPKNVSNLDNDTGYKFGSAYVPSGHFKSIIDKRFACLGKQATDGVMSIAKLDNMDFNKFADGTVADVKTGAHGDVFIYEGGCFQKGVNDKKNEKKYHLYSANITKPQPDDKKAITHVINVESFLTPEAIAAAPVELKYYKNKIVTLAQTIAESLTQSNYNHHSYGVRIKGYKQVRFPMMKSEIVSSKEIITMISDAEGKLLKSIIIPSEDVTFTNGMYYVLDVPAGAEWVYFTLTNTIPFDKVVLTTSTSIFDIEPEWVKVEPFLMAEYETTLNNNALYQSVAKSAIPINDMTIEVARTNATTRKMKLANYSMHSYVANLFLAKYGNRNSQGQNGYSDYYEDKPISDTTITGMRDTVNPQNKSTGSWYEKIGTDGTITLARLNNTKCMGYENIYGNRMEWMDGIDTTKVKDSYSDGLNVTMKDGSKRKAIAYYNSGYIPSVANGLYMDITPVGSSSSNGATSTTKYCDETYISYPADVGDVFTFVCSGNMHVAGAGMFYIYTETSKGNRISCRLAFDGEINLVPTSTFLSINTFA
ncbi:CotH kinase family protein [Empedobacter sp. 225-1]|uniref:CotH kinase family protein n=1 Tax=Empedobacter sp. 225-1 TaxID=2746725 RepID=UPI002576E6BE|nr:CotH kinase family protein [Empedobacter sp. 225-1]MDM1523853.1 CotH kinase family protein [Empedobacter sp. 225-1]